MRSVLLPAVFILLTCPLFNFGSNSDSLIESRNVVLQEINNYRTAMPDSSKESLLPLLQMMNTLITEDNKLFDTLATQMSLQDTALVQAENMKAAFETAKAELATYEEYKQYAMIGGGGLVLIFLIIIIIQSSSKGKLKKKVKKMNKIVHNAEENETRIVKLEEELSAEKNDHKLALEKSRKDQELILQKKEEELITTKAEAEKLKNTSGEIQKLKTEISTKESKISELQREAIQQKRETENAKAEAEKMKQQVSGINEKQLSDLEDKEKLIRDLQEELSRAKRSNNELELEMFQLRNNAKPQENTEESDRLKADLERTETELNESRSNLTKEIETLKIENEEIRQRLETEASIRKEFAENQNEDISSPVSGNNIDQLKKELAEERQLRLDMQQLMEQLLKKD